MKLNLISDIHASYDPKTGEVLYYDKNFYSVNSAKKTFDKLYGEASSISEDARKTVLPKSEYYPFMSNTYDEVMKVLEAVKLLFEDFEANFNKAPAADQLELARLVFGTKSWFYQSKSNIDVHSVDKVSNFLFYRAELFDPAKLEPADYLIIAGDLGYDNIYDAVKADIEKKTAGKFKKVLCIPGNHDHWWTGELSPNVKKPEAPNFSRDTVKFEDGDYVFLGATMWTPISDGWAWSVGRYMNDYRYMPGKPTVYLTSEQYRRQSKWLKSEIEKAKDKKVVVFTHHQPFEEMIGYGFDHSRVNAAYVVMDHSMDDVNKYGNIKIWHCGHSHSRYDETIHNTHVVRCPIGYGSLYGMVPGEIDSTYWYNNIFEV